MALENGFEPELYPYVAVQVPFGTCEAVLAIK